MKKVKVEAEVKEDLTQSQDNPSEESDDAGPAMAGLASVFLAEE